MEQTNRRPLALVPGLDRLRHCQRLHLALLPLEVARRFISPLLKIGYSLSLNTRAEIYTLLTIPLYWLLGTSFQEKTDLACPITLIPGHGTRLRDKGNLFFSLSERGKLK